MPLKDQSLVSCHPLWDHLYDLLNHLSTLPPARSPRDHYSQT